MHNAFSQTHLNELKSRLPESVFGADPTPYQVDPRRILVGRSTTILRPDTTQQVSEIVRYAFENNLAVIPYGGGTGLVGAQVYPDDPAPVVLSLERMNKIRSQHPRENVLIAEAGVTLAAVQDAAKDIDRLFPLSLASEGTARIGGNLSTNAGGVQVLRYGNARDLCLGLEAVLPNGDIWNGLKRLRKDNTGYDLRNLLIGAEGTLGVITAASLRLFPRPQSYATALLSVTSPSAALDLLSLGQDKAGAGLTAFELLHETGFGFLEATGLPGSDFLTPRPEWAVLVEIALPDGFDAQKSMEDLFASGHDKGWVLDGVIAQSEKQRDALWNMRESMPEANKRIGAIASHDISVPLEAIPAMIDEGRRRIAAKFDFRVNVFGHLGDGNLHFNVFPPDGKSKADYPGSSAQVSQIVHDLAIENGGSFSAEHGVGRFKVAALETYGDPTKLAAMRAIKAALDPKGIMNPGAVLRAKDIPVI